MEAGRAEERCPRSRSAAHELDLSDWRETWVLRERTRWHSVTEKESQRGQGIGAWFPEGRMLPLIERGRQARR